MSAQGLGARGVLCYRGEHCLFRQLDLDLAPGEVLHVQGRNGSGKTTLLRILCGLVQADEGEILWNGESIRRCRSEFNADLIYVGHHDGLKGELTPLENLAMDQTLNVARDNADASAALATLGLHNRDDVPCRALSAGQKRRVSLARLMVTQAKLWVLDEPLTALDPAGRQAVADLLTEHAQAGGMAIYTTHQALELAGVTQRSLSLDA
jgi:heme exporter protein A